ncbi:SHOCT domain-containing protein [Staphylococcus aureus]|uniref:SHOCT domain-containing protein n=1 Tax=Staphylococcus aureus TaxID=1280 RepID=UPI0021AA5682|nr:SHOCT domain-containing protein [Staphylococcus aureus]
MKQKFWDKFNASEYANDVIDFESDCVPSIGSKVFMSGGVMITLDSVLIVTRKDVYEFKIGDLDDFKLHNKFLEKGIILHSWKQNIYIKINFPDERDRKLFFDQFQETFDRLRIAFEDEHGSIYGDNNEHDKTVEQEEEPQNNIQQKKIPYEELKQLKELLDMGALTQEEFDAKKKELLNL